MRRLIVAPAWLGDVVMSHALIQFLAESSPMDTLDILLPKSCIELVQRMDEINQCHIDPCRHGELGLHKRYQVAKMLRQHSYDQAIILKNSLKSAIIPFLAGIKQRSSWLGEHRFGLINDIHPFTNDQCPLMVQRFLRLGVDDINQLPNHHDYYPKLNINTSNQTKCIHELQLNSTRPILALCPGAAYGPSKRWPIGHFTKLAQEKIAQGYQVWIFGSIEEQAEAKKLENTVGEHTHNLCGRTNIGDAIDLLALADVVVCNDSGLMHISAALARPLVAIYGATAEHFAPPLSPCGKRIYIQLDCRPCRQRECPYGHYRCLTDISVDAVHAAIDEALDTYQRKIKK